MWERSASDRPGSWDPRAKALIWGPGEGNLLLALLQGGTEKTNVSFPLCTKVFINLFSASLLQKGSRGGPSWCQHTAYSKLKRTVFSLAPGLCLVHPPTPKINSEWLYQSDLDPRFLEKYCGGWFPIAWMILKFQSIRSALMSRSHLKFYPLKIPI